jgi:hypothetical protein
VLAEWRVQGGQVVAIVRAGDPSKLGHGTHVDQSFGGTVSRLTGTAPDLAFVLSNDHMGVHIVTNADTHVSNHDGTENPVIHDGATVHIRGAFDHQANTVTATEVVIRNQHHVDSAAADGTVGSVGTDSFTLTVHNAYRFHPSHSTMRVTTSEATTFAIGGVAAHSADFYAAVKVGAVVAVHGAYDPTTNTFAATHVGLIRHGHENHHRVAASGPVSEVNAHAGTFNLTVRAWEGTELSNGAVIHVVTNAHTQLEGLTLDHLANGESVRVVGVLDGSTLTAMSVSRSHHP